MARTVLGAADDARFVPYAEAERLGPVELRILERREPDKAIEQGLRKLGFFEIELVGECQCQRRRHGPGQPLRQGGRRLPGFGLVLRGNEGDVKRMGAAGRAENHPFDIPPVHVPDGRQECPLVGDGLKDSIDKHAASLLARLLLQRQGDQVAEAAFGQHILIGKEPVVGRKLKLPGSGAGVADDGRANPARVTRCDGRREEDPGVRTVTRARNLERYGNVQFVARLPEGHHIVPPAFFIEVDSEQVTGAIGHQWVQAHRVIASQVRIDDLLVHRQEHAMRTIRAPDAGFFADARAPLVCARRRVTRLSGIAAFPTQRIDVRAAAEKAPEKLHFLLRRKGGSACTSPSRL